MFDIQIHPRDHDLILATHGRSIWIMDNIHALEQMNAQVLTSDLKLFDTRPAIGVEDGGLPWIYWLRAVLCAECAEWGVARLLCEGVGSGAGDRGG